MTTSSPANATHCPPMRNGSPPVCAAATVTELASRPSRRHMPGISSSASM
ncbi:hypothetical protein QFZ49_002715 [Streptomyces turgidiscabies]|uniref:Uncharacterized protein n=1 Tax=Streptomyces turgidiscabies TaxID=85558 RepID=A0ABU0RLC7_9ACTN|nr:hypothetical protein [Streptomyces turgidiscabies]